MAERHFLLKNIVDDIELAIPSGAEWLLLTAEEQSRFIEALEEARDVVQDLNDQARLRAREQRRRAGRVGVGGEDVGKRDGQEGGTAVSAGDSSTVASDL